MWSHWICDTQTGNRLQQVHPSACRWKTSITSIGDASHSFQLRDRETELDRATWQNLAIPWARSLVTCWDDVPVYAGLGSGWAYDPFTGVLEIRSKELRVIFGSRMPFQVPEYAPTGVMAVSGKSLRGIMRQIIYWGALKSPPTSGWWLPIALPGDESGGEARSWQHYNFETVEQLIGQIEDADGGPDLNLRPRWSATGSLEWDARIGTPLLGGPTFEYDLTAPDNGLTSFAVTADASKQLTGVFGLGKGSEADMKYGLGRNSDVPGPNIPNLDATRSFKTLSDPAVLTQRAVSELRAFRWPSTVTNPNPLAADVLPSMVLGSTIRAWISGDGFLPDGWASSIVTSMSGDGSERLTLEVL